MSGDDAVAVVADVAAASKRNKYVIYELVHACRNLFKCVVSVCVCLPHAFVFVLSGGGAGFEFRTPSRRVVVGAPTGQMPSAHS